MVLSVVDSFLDLKRTLGETAFFFISNLDFAGKSNV